MIAEARSHVEHRGRSRQSAPANSCHRVHKTICWILRLYRGIIRRLSCLIGPCSGHRAHSIYHRATAISLCLSSRSAPVWSSMSCDKQAWISSSLNFRSPSQHSSSRSNTKSRAPNTVTDSWLTLSVAYSWQTFPAVQRKNSAAEKKIRSPTKFDFLKAFGQMKILLFVSICLQKV